MIHGFFGRHQFSQWVRTVATVRPVTLGTKSLPSEHANVRVIRGRHETFLSLRLGTQWNGSARHTKHQRLQASGPTGRDERRIVYLRFQPTSNRRASVVAAFRGGRTPVELITGSRTISGLGSGNSGGLRGYAEL